MEIKINLETRIHKITKYDNNVYIRAGLNGNWYCFSKSKEKLKELCRSIGKSIDSIYYRKEYKCYAIRIRSKVMIKKLKIYKEGGVINDSNRIKK